MNDSMFTEYLSFVNEVEEKATAKLSQLLEAMFVEFPDLYGIHFDGWHLNYNSETTWESAYRDRNRNPIAAKLHQFSSVFQKLEKMTDFGCHPYYFRNGEMTMTGVVDSPQTIELLGNQSET